MTKVLRADSVVLWMTNSMNSPAPKKTPPRRCGICHFSPHGRSSILIRPLAHPPPSVPASSVTQSTLFYSAWWVTSLLSSYTSPSRSRSMLPSLPSITAAAEATCRLSTQKGLFSPPAHISGALQVLGRLVFLSHEAAQIQEATPSALKAMRIKTGFHSDN